MLTQPRRGRYDQVTKIKEQKVARNALSCQQESWMSDELFKFNTERDNLKGSA